jgi:hypothetical protein
MDRKESTASRAPNAWRTLAALTFIGATAVGACSKGGPETQAAPVPATSNPLTLPGMTGEVEATQFDRSLDVDLSKMTRRPTGLYVQDFEIGTGAVAARSRTAVVRYAGYLPSGKKFDSGEITITLGTGRVIRAWEDGVLGMRVGGRRRLVSPPHLAYGVKGAPPDIPPNAVLVFDMELLQVY